MAPAVVAGAAGDDSVAAGCGTGLSTASLTATGNQVTAGKATRLSLLHTDTSTALFVRAYNEQGPIVSHLSAKDISGWLHRKEKLLDRALGGIRVATLGLWSSPAGADVYLDGRLVGKTPSSFSTVPGEYTITMRKQNFGTWQRKLQVTEGKRRVSGYLEQKVVVIGSVMP